MFIIDRVKNEANSLERKTFSELNFKERKNLQEWIDKNPKILGEDLLIIQKEFDGFSDTNERLDLLALDRNGNLVIIENKLDDSGKDVTWQALKYVSYASSLSKNDINGIYQKYLDTYKHHENGSENLSNYFNTDYSELQLNEGDQRIILVSAAFRKEVTSTVMWLLDHGIKIQCIKVTPYQNQDQIFLDTEQILPSPDTEDYRIKVTNKKQEEYKTQEQNNSIRNIRFKFWEKALPKIQEVSHLFQNVNPSKDNWLTGSTGIGGITFNMVITQKSVRVELYIYRSSKEENKNLYDKLFEMKGTIEREFNSQLEWYRLDDKTASRIALSHDNFDLNDETTWDKAISFLACNVNKFNQIFLKALHDCADS